MGSLLTTSELSEDKFTPYKYVLQKFSQLTVTSYIYYLVKSDTIFLLVHDISIVATQNNELIMSHFCYLYFYLEKVCSLQYFPLWRITR